MKEQENHIEDQFFSNANLKHKKSKAQVWDNIEAFIDKEETSNETPEAKVVSFNWQPIGLAASVVLVLGLGLLARFYTTSVVASKGQFVTHSLPDGSTVNLNAESSIAYQPYWWWSSREVNLQGEAYFEVAKGEKFTVSSNYGQTEVLGTQFNVYARGGDYRVYCNEGKVRVTTANKYIDITPGQMASRDGKTIKLDTNITKSSGMSWRVGKFNYNTTPLKKVIADVERHYDVSISIAEGIDSLHYTGVFDRADSAVKTLTVICHSLGLELEETDSKSFFIKQ